MFGIVPVHGGGLQTRVSACVQSHFPVSGDITLPMNHVFKENKLKMAKHCVSLPRYTQAAATDLSKRLPTRLVAPDTHCKFQHGVNKKRKAEDTDLHNSNEIAIQQNQCCYVPSSPAPSQETAKSFAYRSFLLPPKQTGHSTSIVSGLSATTNSDLLSSSNYCANQAVSGTSKALSKVNTSQGDYAIVVGELLRSSNESYEVLAFLGRGTFGQVVKCRCVTSKRCVAIKILKNLPSYLRQGNVEIQILQTLSQQDTESYNIVRAIECFQHKNHMCFVFELLEQNLYEYLKSNKFRPLSLPEIRPITQQVLTALSKLKALGLIHADLKPENIMLVSSTNGPMRYRVKVIDFGSACHSSKAVQNTYLQSRYYRAPEILLGLPFNEAIDMWSLGCVIAELFLGWPLYPGSSEYDQMRYIVETQGPPPPDLLQNAGKRSTFFVRDPYRCDWRLKTQEEYALETGQQAKEARKYFFTSLDQICDVSGLLPSTDPDSELELEDRQQFASLLSLMLKMRPSERVLPDTALFHPFITMTHLQACPFSKRFHDSIALMQVCHEGTRRRQLFNCRNSTDQFKSLPSLNEQCSSEAVSVLPSPADSSALPFLAANVRNPDNQQSSSTVAYYAAAAVAALAKPNQQAVTCTDPDSAINCLQEQYSVSLNADEQQHAPVSLLSHSNHNCSFVNQHPTATVFLTQNKPAVRPHMREDASGLLNSCVSVPQSLSLYDLVAAGGTALSLLNAVTVPVSSTSDNNRLRSSSHASYDYMPQQIQQHQLPLKYCKLDSGHLSINEAEKAALMLSSYLGQEKVQLSRCEPYVSVPSLTSGANPGRLEATDIHTTLNAFVQQHPLCRNPTALTVIQQQHHQRQGLTARQHKSFLVTTDPHNLCTTHPAGPRSTGLVLPSSIELLNCLPSHSQHRTRAPQGGQNHMSPLHMSTSKPHEHVVYGQKLQHSAAALNPVNSTGAPILSTAHSSDRSSFRTHPSLVFQRPQQPSTQISIHSSVRFSRTPSPLTSISTDASCVAASTSEVLPINLATTSDSDLNTFRCSAQKLASSDSSFCGSHADWVRYHACSTSGLKSFDHPLQDVLNSRSTAGFSISTTSRCPLTSVPHLTKASECQLLPHSVGGSLNDLRCSPSVACSGITTTDPDNLSVDGMDRLDSNGNGTFRGTVGANLPVAASCLRSDKKIPVGRVQPMIKQEDVSSSVYVCNRFPTSASNFVIGSLQNAFVPSVYNELNRQHHQPCVTAQCPSHVLCRQGSLCSPDNRTIGSVPSRTSCHKQSSRLSFPCPDPQTQSARHLSAAHAAAAAYHNLMYFQLQQQQQQQQQVASISLSTVPTVHPIHLHPAHHCSSQTASLQLPVLADTCWSSTKSTAPKLDDPTAAAAASYYAAAAAAELKLLINQHSVQLGKPSVLSVATDHRQQQFELELLRQQAQSHLANKF